MKSKITLLVLILSGLAMAQGPDIEWDKKFGGTGDDSGHCFAPTPDGGYIIGATSKSSNGDLTLHHGSEAYDDIWVFKTNASGNLQWQKSMGGSKEETISSIIATSDGGYILCGSSKSNDGDVAGHYGSDSFEDVWIVKLNAGGDIQWTKIYGAASKDIGKSIIQTPDGGYLVLASLYQDFNGPAPVSYGSKDFWLLKLNTEGEMQWQNKYGGTNEDDPVALWATDGGYMMAGTTNSQSHDVTGLHVGSGPPMLLFDIWVVKVNETGVLQWSKCIGGSSADYLYSASPTSDGGCFLAAFSNSTDGDAAGSGAIGKGWTVKLDANANIIWQRFVGLGGENPKSVRATSDNGCIVSGYYNDGSDPYLMKLNSLGQVQWERILGDEYGITWFEGAMQTSDSGYLGIGMFINDNVNQPADYDVRLLKLETEVLGVASFSSDSFILYPNPAIQRLYLQTGLSLNGQARIYDSSGKMIDAALGTGNSIDVSGFASGIYILECNTSDNQTIRRRFVKN